MVNRADTVEYLITPFRFFPRRTNSPLSLDSSAARFFFFEASDQLDGRADSDYH